jgi:hypothetical protein
VFGALDSDTQVEQTEKLIAASLEISDDEKDEQEEEDEKLSLPLHRHTHTQASLQRTRKVDR